MRNGRHPSPARWFATRHPRGWFYDVIMSRQPAHRARLWVTRTPLTACGLLKLTSDSLATHLGERLLPAYLVSGDEPLLAAEAADAVRARARGAGFTQREVHFIERAADWDEVRASAANLSLFAARRVMEIRL